MFETFTVRSQPNGLFLVEESWPQMVQFSREFFIYVDERFVKYSILDNNKCVLIVKLENAYAEYMLDTNPFEDEVESLIIGNLIEGFIVKSGVQEKAIAL